MPSSVDKRTLRLIRSRYVVVNECWIWTGRTAPGRGGYGLIHWNGRPHRAHRAHWQLVNGPLSDSLHLDHLCREERCINLRHLEPVIPAENTRRGFTPGALATLTNRCMRGHELDTKRHCHKCERRNALAYHLKAGVTPKRIDGHGARKAPGGWACLCGYWLTSGSTRAARAVQQSHLGQVWADLVREWEAETNAGIPKTQRVAVAEAVEPADCSRRHWYTVFNEPGIRSPLCRRCGTPSPRRLTPAQWDTYRQWQTRSGNDPWRSAVRDLLEADARG